MIQVSLSRAQQVAKNWQCACRKMCQNSPGNYCQYLKESGMLWSIEGEGLACLETWATSSYLDLGEIHFSWTFEERWRRPGDEASHQSGVMRKAQLWCPWWRVVTLTWTSVGNEIATTVDPQKVTRFFCKADWSDRMQLLEWTHVKLTTLSSAGVSIRT